MIDLIERSAALEAICAKCPRRERADGCTAGCIARRALREMRGIDAERVDLCASWYDSGHGWYGCGACKMLSSSRSEFCPRCGAKMKKEVARYGAKQR